MDAHEYQYRLRVVGKIPSNRHAQVRKQSCNTVSSQYGFHASLWCPNSTTINVHHKRVALSQVDVYWNASEPAQWARCRVEAGRPNYVLYSSRGLT